MCRTLTLGLFVALAACAPPAEDREATSTGDTAQVETAAANFLSYAHSFDYAAMRAHATSDFEILIFGRRLDLDAFIALLRGMEESRDGRAMSDYELEELNTEIVGDVAYTSWASPGWLESAILVRSGDRWLMDRGASVPVEGGR